MAGKEETATGRIGNDMSVISGHFTLSGCNIVALGRCDGKLGTLDKSQPW